MRYEVYRDQLTVHTYLEHQMGVSGTKFEMTDAGMEMQTNDGQTIFFISNDGFLVLNLRMCTSYHRVVSTFARETLGKNLLVIWRRGNIRAYIYEEGKNWKDTEHRYSCEDIFAKPTVAIFDLLLNPISGVKKMAPTRKIDPTTGRAERKTTSQW